MEIINNIDQGSQDWLELRLGKVTASRFKDVLAKGRGSAPSKKRQSYMMQLAAERLTGLPQDAYTNAAMEWGTETEPQARSMYELRKGIDVDQCAFIVHDENIGVSPDGLIGNDGLIEIKCPKTTTQIERYLSGEFPTEYKAQVMGQLWVSQREWCDFVSFDPRINGAASFFVTRVHRDEGFISSLENAVNIFLEEMFEIVSKCRA